MTTKKTDDIKKYAKLIGKVDYDHEAVDQLAEALNEIRLIEGHAAQLRQIVDENKELHQFVWRTAEGVTIALHNIENDHLSNIMLHLLQTGRAIPRAIRGEAIQRGLTIPVSSPFDAREAAVAKLLGMRDREDVGF